MGYKGPTNIVCNKCNNEIEVNKYVDNLYCDKCKETIFLSATITDYLAERFLNITKGEANA